MTTPSQLDRETAEKIVKYFQLIRPSRFDAISHIAQFIAYPHAKEREMLERIKRKMNPTFEWQSVIRDEITSLLDGDKNLEAQDGGNGPSASLITEPVDPSVGQLIIHKDEKTGMKFCPTLGVDGIEKQLAEKDALADRLVAWVDWLINDKDGTMRPSQYFEGERLLLLHAEARKGKV